MDSYSLLLALLCIVKGEELGKEYEVAVGPGTTVTFQTYATNKPVRVAVDSPYANASHPVLITVSQGSKVVLLQLPTTLQGIPYTRAERTLCPPCPGLDSCPSFPVTVAFLPHVVNITVMLSVSTVTNYYLSIQQPVMVTVAPNAPQHFIFIYQANVSDILVRFTSDEVQCAHVSVQYSSCPDDTSLTPPGSYQWMEGVGAITTARKRGETTRYLYAVVQVFPSGPNGCPSESAVPISKNVTLVVLEPITSSGYVVAVLIPTLVFMLSYVIAFFWIVVFDWIRYHSGSVFLLLKRRHGSSSSSHRPDRARDGRDQVDGGSAVMKRPSFLSVLSGAYSLEMIEPVSKIELSSWGDQLMSSGDGTHDPDGTSDDPDGTHEGTHDPDGTSDDPDGTHEGTHDPDGTSDDPNGTHEGTHDPDGTSDDPRGTSDKLQHEYIGQLQFLEKKKPHNHYAWFLVSMVILYGIPAYQLAMTYQEFNLSGNQESCYYNFLCTRPLQVSASFSFAAFNNVYSNVGYVILGVLILLLNYRRRCIHKAFELTNERLIAEEKLGVPTYFGVYYASGIAIIAIGAMSTAYHMCPSRRNYQFDTTFMYVLAGLGMYRLLKARNPDITPKMHHVMFALAFLILLVVIGGLYAPQSDGWPIYALFALIYLMVFVIMALEIYYRWTITGWLSVKTTFDQLGCPPSHKPKFVMMVTMILLNTSILLYGFGSRPSDFATYLLFIMIVNMLAMLAYYCAVKCYYREWKMEWESLRPLSYFLLSLMFWGAGVYFYMNAGTNWLESPPRSRNGNVDCLVLQFYDYHDCWHFASSFALFFTILMLMALDDQQRLTQRNALKVF